MEHGQREADWRNQIRNPSTKLLFRLSPAEDGLHTVIIHMYAFLFDTFQTLYLQKSEKKRAKRAQTQLQIARDAQAKLQNATCETTHVHNTFCGKNDVHTNVVHKAFLDPKAGGHNVIESANTVVCESAKAFPRGV